MKEALFYVPLENKKVRCVLCPNFCELFPGETGICKVRSNADGKLVTHVYNKVAAFGIDPIEKKPLYHFHPGKKILSIGQVGCNLRCRFCQNYRISQCHAEEYANFEQVTAEHIILEAKNTPNNIGIAFTYNEPFTFYEFMLETAVLSHKKGLKNVVVSNGYINSKPLNQLLPYIDAFNIDLKAFTDEFYKKYTGGHLQPVLETLITIAKSDAHLEITNLVIPGLNDDIQNFTKMVDWISREIGTEIPFHISRYFPHHELKTGQTPLHTLELLFDIAKQKLSYVYLGNVSDTSRSDTFCPECKEIVVERNHYQINKNNLSDNGTCSNCGYSINIAL